MCLTSSRISSTMVCTQHSCRESLIRTERLIQNAGEIDFADVKEAADIEKRAMVPGLHCGYTRAFSESSPFCRGKKVLRFNVLTIRLQDAQ